MINNTIVLVGIGLISVGLPAYAVIRPVEQGSQDASGLQIVPNPPSVGSGNEPPCEISNTKKVKLLLGIQPGTVNDALKYQLKLDGFSGVLVEGIVPGSPADKAGIKKYDVITKVGDKSISVPINIREGIADAQPGDKVPVELYRSGTKQTVELVLDQMLCIPEGKENEWQKFPSQKNIQEALGVGRVPIPNAQFNDDIHHMFKMMDDLMLMGGNMNNAGNARQQLERMRQMHHEMHKRLRNPSGSGINVRESFNSSRSTTIKYHDGQGVIEINSDSDKGTQLTVKDNNGNVVFNGPYSSAEDKEKIPDNIKERLKVVSFSIRR